MIKVYKLPEKPKEDITIEVIDVGSNWIHKMVGIRLIHWPTRTVIECTDEKTQHANKARCMDRLKYLLGTNMPKITKVTVVEFVSNDYHNINPRAWKNLEELGKDYALWNSGQIGWVKGSTLENDYPHLTSYLECLDLPSSFIIKYDWS